MSEQGSERLIAARLSSSDTVPKSSSYLLAETLLSAHCPCVLVGQRNNAIVQRTAEYVAEQEEFAVTLLVQGQGIEIVFFDAADIDRIGGSVCGGCVDKRGC